MKIEFVSDTHGDCPKLSGGDLLIFGGDLARNHHIREINKMCRWLKEQPHEKKIFVGGNHDTFLLSPSFNKEEFEEKSGCEYLQDSLMSYKGVTIWGTPWTGWFFGINPVCSAFTANERDLSEHFSKIPDGVDIVVSHSPPFGIFDKVYKANLDAYIKVGSASLLERLQEVKPKYNLFGHIHEHGSETVVIDGITFVNGSRMDDNYEPMNNPICFEYVKEF